MIRYDDICQNCKISARAHTLGVFVDANDNYLVEAPLEKVWANGMYACGNFKPNNLKYLEWKYENKK
jgi:hypothetical protein